MKRWLLPIALLVLGTLLAVGAGYGANAALGSAIALGDGESLETVRPGAGSAVAEREGGGDDAAPTPAPGEVVAADAGPRGQPRAAYIKAIMDRNIFDSANVGMTAASEDEPCEGEDCSYEKSDLPVTLLATAVAYPEEFSAALLLEENKSEANGYGVGDKILDATITRIEERRVIVQRDDGREEFIVATEEDAPTKRGSTSSNTTASADEGITKVSDDEYVLDRSLVDTALSDLDGLSRMARARPHKDAQGNVDGFRLSGVRRNKLGYKIGIRSGDVVHAVNGQPLTSLQEAMGAMNSLQNGSAFEFQITRRGQKKTLKYSVR